VITLETRTSSEEKKEKLGNALKRAFPKKKRKIKKIKKNP
jgi:hypothetical protein